MERSFNEKKGRLNYQGKSDQQVTDSEFFFRVGVVVLIGILLTLMFMGCKQEIHVTHAKYGYYKKYNRECPEGQVIKIKARKAWSDKSNYRKR